MGIRSVRRACAAALVCACSFSVSAALAAAFVTKTARSGNQTFEAANDPHLLDLGESNGTSLEVHTVGPSTRLLILFNAECTVAGAMHDDYVLIQVLVDGLIVSPSGAGHAFCTADGDSALDGWITASSDVSTVVGAGIHQVELRGELIGPGVAGDDWLIGDLSLIVIAKNL